MYSSLLLSKHSETTAVVVFMSIVLQSVGAGTTQYTAVYTLLFYVLFTPVIWGHQGGSSLTFKPYASPAGYIPSIPCTLLSSNPINGPTNNTTAATTVNLRFARSSSLVRRAATDPKNDAVRSSTQILSKVSVPATVSESLQALWIGPLGMFLCIFTDCDWLSNLIFILFARRLL